MDAKKLREVLTARHGGTEGCTDAELATIWRSLTAEDQARYLKTAAKKTGGDDETRR